MTLVPIQRGLISPHLSMTSTSGVATLDLITEKTAHIGRLYINGRPSGTKTLSTGTIAFRTGAVIFANGLTTLDVGLQGVASGAGPIAQPDGTYTVKTTLTGGAGLTTTAWNTITMTSGTVSLSHGDLVAVVWDMTARAGADSVTITPTSNFFGSAVAPGFPATNAFFTAAWQTALGSGAGRLPNVVITFDDGTIGTIDGSYPLSAITTDTFATGTNPNERGMIFQLPWNVKVDALCVTGGITDGSSDFTLKLYSDPLGTPTLLASVAVEASNIGAATGIENFITATLASEIALSRNTDYAVTMLATGSSNSRLTNYTLGSSAHRAFYPGGTTIVKATRNGSTGVFAAEGAATTVYPIGVKISQVDDGAGSGGGTSAYVIGS